MWRVLELLLVAVLAALGAAAAPTTTASAATFIYDAPTIARGDLDTGELECEAIRMESGEQVLLASLVIESPEELGSQIRRLISACDDLLPDAGMGRGVPTRCTVPCSVPSSLRS